jgi:hypothetical protein
MELEMDAPTSARQHAGDTTTPFGSPVEPLVYSNVKIGSAVWVSNGSNAASEYVLGCAIMVDMLCTVTQSCATERGASKPNINNDTVHAKHNNNGEQTTCVCMCVCVYVCVSECHQGVVVKLLT